MFESDQPFVVERTMSWPFSVGPAPPQVPTLDAYGAHAEAAVDAPAMAWHFAEGATHSGFNLFFLVKNDAPHAVTVTATYLRPAPNAPVVRSYELAPAERRTIWVNFEDVGLAATDVATSFAADGGVVVERAMYRDAPGEPFGAGHGAAGSLGPATRWWFAEGVTNDAFDTFLLVANPGPAAADVRVHYLLADGTNLARDLQVAPFSRANVWVDFEDPRLRQAEFGLEIESSGAGVVAERAVWWPGPSPLAWRETHVSAGATALARKWVTADGEVGGDRRAATYLLLLNPSLSAVSVQVAVVFDDGGSVTNILTVPARGRATFDVGARVPSASGRRFAAEVEVLDAAAPGIVVERATYWDSRAQVWAAGVGLRATPFPLNGGRRAVPPIMSMRGPCVAPPACDWPCRFLW